MISFDFPPESVAVRDRVRKFVDEVIGPAEREIRDGNRERREVIKELQPIARKEGIWVSMLPKEAGGMGLDPLTNALVMIELGKTSIGHAVCNSQGPDDASMVTIWERGTDYQKEKYLKPLVDGEARICYSMTEENTGSSDATNLKTSGVRDGDNWIINGEKWFSSGANTSNFALMIVKTNPEDTDRHRQFSAFLVDLPDPAIDISVIPMAGSRGTPDPKVTGHCRLLIRDLVVPHANLVGGEGEGFNMGQLRLGYGRLRHGFQNLATGQRVLDRATERAINRETFGERIADRQAIQFMLADCARDLYIGRLMVLHVAYLIGQKKDFTEENRYAKVWLANMVAKIVDTAIQIHGAAGLTREIGLGDLYLGVRQQRLVDGPDEVHTWRVGRDLIKAYEEHGTTASVCGGDLGL